MKLVIDISEDVYTRLFDNGIQDNEIAVDDVCEMARAIRLGKPHETVTEFADRCRECGREKVLDKIRAEITNIPITDTDGHNSNWYREPQAVINDVLHIIDKHKAESEAQDGE